MKNATGKPQPDQANSNEVEKAYGGCHLCYGKGYSTARVGTSSKYGNVTHDTIKYCSCDRGKQLQSVVDTAVNRGRVSEIDWVHKNTELIEMSDKKPAFIIRGAKLDKRVAELTKANSIQLGADSKTPEIEGIKKGQPKPPAPQPLQVNPKSHNTKEDK